MYQENVAYAHHKGFGELAAAAGPELLKIFRAHRIVEGHVVDVGCGDGTWLRTLTEAGFAATGIDQSAVFVRLARGAAPLAAVRRASLYRVAFPRCDAMTALGEVFNYLPSGAKTSPSLFRVFRRAHAALRPGGVLIFDLLVSGRPLMHYETARAGSDWAVFTRVSEDRKHHRLARQIVAFRRSGSRYTREQETHTLQVPSHASVLSDLRRAGFIAHASARYGALALARRRVAFVATKTTLPNKRLQPTTLGAIVKRRG
jgi:SAM-dependent methyltransferase